MIHRIWAVGASVRALAQSLVADGYEVVAADLFNDYDLQQIAEVQRVVDYPRDLMRLADEIEADAWIYTGGLENYPDVVDQLASRRLLLGNGGDVLRRVRDVWMLQRTLSEAGFEMPEMTRDLPTDAATRWLRKSQHSSGGRHIRFAHNKSMQLADDEYFQRFVEGTTYGAAFIASDEGARLLAITRQLDCPWANAPPFHYTGSIGPAHSSPEIYQQVVRLGDLLAERFSLRGWFGVDFIVDGDSRLFVLDVNPRYTASIEVIQRGQSVKTARAHVAAFGNGADRQSAVGVPPSGSRGWGPAEAGTPTYDHTSLVLCGKAVLYAPHSVRISQQIAEQLQARWRLYNDLADLPAADQTIRAGAPILTVLARGKSEEGVVEQLRSMACEVYRLIGIS